MMAQLPDAKELTRNQIWDLSLFSENCAGTLEICNLDRIGNPSGYQSWPERSHLNRRGGSRFALLPLMSIVLTLIIGLMPSVHAGTTPCESLLSSSDFFRDPSDHSSERPWSIPIPTTEEIQDLTERSRQVMERMLEENARMYETINEAQAQLDELRRPRPGGSRGKGAKPRRADLNVPRRHLKAAIKASRRTNIPFDILALGMATRGFPEDRAGIAGRLIVKQILSAGQAAQRGDLDAAMDLLDDPALLEGTPFFHRSNRERISVDRISGTDEREYSYKLVRSLRIPPAVSARGAVAIPLPPRAAASTDKLRWAQREFIRTAAEELGHVAQILLDRENPGGSRISQLMGPERSTVRSLVALEGERLNQAMEKTFGTALALHFFVFHNKEADIYAFLIEAFGSEFIPNWVGIDYGYEIRRLVDDELTARGMPGRAWPGSNAVANVANLAKVDR